MIHLSAVHSRQTELTCNKLTQLHDALLVTRVSVTKLIGCTAAVCEFANCNSVQFSSSALYTALELEG